MLLTIDAYVRRNDGELVLEPRVINMNHVMYAELIPLDIGDEDEDAHARLLIHFPPVGESRVGAAPYSLLVPYDEALEFLRQCEATTFGVQDTVFEPGVMGEEGSDD